MSAGTDKTDMMGRDDMRWLIAGGAGFLGSHLTRSLLEDGHNVIVADDISTGDLRNLDGLDCDIIVSDVTQAPALDVDIIVHAASPASPVMYDKMPIHTLLANSAGTLHLLALADQVGAKFVYLSTSEIYGDPLVHPQPETYWGNVNTLGPRACYDEGKRFGEAAVMAMRRERSVRASIIRLFNAYGPHMREDDGRVIPAFVGAALDGQPLIVHGDGMQSRSFCYVDDTVRGIRAVAEDPANDGEVYNIGNPDEVTIRHVAERVVALVGREDPPVLTQGARPEGDPGRRKPVIDKMRHRYGWEPTVSLDDGLRQTIAWWRDAKRS